MAAALVRHAWQDGRAAAARTVRILRAFRHTLEALRDAPPGSGLAQRRYADAAARASVDESELVPVVREWMFERPLPVLSRFPRAGLASFLRWFRLEAPGARRLGVLSDYPPLAKLEALGVDREFCLRLCCDDPDIDAFKPHPAGFRRASTIWGLRPDEVLYIGDRRSVDLAGARAASMRCVIIGTPRFRDFHSIRRWVERTSNSV